MRFDQLTAITGGTLYNSDNGPCVFQGVSIDSRSLHAGELFVAIRGERNDGHQFVKAAIERGASGVLVEYNFPELEGLRGDVAVVAVPDAHEAMMTLAKDYRDRLASVFVGITGSNGKTTVKELTYSLLEAVSERNYRSPGNLNNLYGVPLALFAVPQDTEVAVMEMGISTHHEMPKLAEIVRPDVALLTNVGASHLETLGTVADVARAKLAILQHDSEDATAAIINADDPVLLEETRKVRAEFITFGLDSDADFRPSAVQRAEDGGSRVTLEGHEFVLPLAGKHQVYNLTAAYAIVRTLGYKFDQVDTGAIELTTAPMRGQRERRQGIDFVVDCYNANPVSIRTGLAAFSEMPAEGRRIVILGDMLELGPDSEKLHREIGEYLATLEFDMAILVGPLSAATHGAAHAAGVDGRRLCRFDEVEQCVDIVRDLLRPGDLVYVKASRGIGLETVINAFQTEEGEA